MSSLAALAVTMTIGMWLVAATQFTAAKAAALVLPGSALLWMGVAFYLFMLGLVAEVALSSERGEVNDTPTAWEVR